MSGSTPRATGRRVVVTGVGILCGVGIGTEEVWKALQAGQSGIAPITLFDASQHPCRFAGEVKGFDPLNWVEKKELKKMGRFIQFALAATDFALAAAQLKLSPELAPRAGVYIGSGIGGFDVIEREHSKLLQGGPGKISPFFVPATIINLAAGHISIRYGARGPNSATATACSASAHAVGRLQDHPARRCRSDDLRRRGGRHYPDGRRRLCGHEGAFHAQ